MYAGDMGSREVFEVLKQDPNSSLVDVRTTREWETIGVPDLDECQKEVIFAEWQMFPTMMVDSEFASKVDKAITQKNHSKSERVFCLCRSGVRSKGAAAALTQIGYTNAYNINDGFEGVPNEAGERSKINGWLFEGLPHKSMRLHE